MKEPEDMTEDELVEAAQGCTELTCMYHGPYNLELRNRRPDAKERES